MKGTGLRIKVKLAVFLGVLLIIILIAGWFCLERLEGTKPVVDLKIPSSNISVTQTISVAVTDNKSGIRGVKITFEKDGKTFVLREKAYSPPGLGKSKRVHNETFEIPFEPKKLGITDGSGAFKINVSDYSWRRWGNGNITSIEMAVSVDSKNPDISILSRTHYFTQGGAGLVIYKLSEYCPEHGVQVGDLFFPGISGEKLFGSKDVFLSFIAIHYTQSAETEIVIRAADPSGNITRRGFPYNIRKKRFPKDTVNISDKFLNWKMPEFHVDIPKNSDNPLRDTFLQVNRTLRQENIKEVAELGKNTGNEIFWEAAFLRLPNSAKRAGFGDFREYRYQGKIIDQETHLGVDLASLANAPIPAANNGKVVFTGNIGIFGNTVMIDHGFGLFSMYSHLNVIDVENKQMVKKGEIIGKTGSTGLAAGDHLHFAIMIHHIFVDPLEWWDPKWIKNNITSKITEAKAALQP